MPLTLDEENRLKAILAREAAATESKRLLDLEHRRMRLGRTGLTVPENAELDAHLAAREAAAGTATITRVR